MKKFVGAYCIYDPDNYQGHQLRRFEAESLEEAMSDMAGWLLQNIFQQVPDIEIQVYEYVDRAGPKLYSIEKKEWC